MKFSIKDVVSKCEIIRSKLQIWSHLLNKILNGQLHFLCSGTYSNTSATCEKCMEEKKKGSNNNSSKQNKTNTIKTCSHNNSGNISVEILVVQSGKNYSPQKLILTKFKPIIQLYIQLYIYKLKYSCNSQFHAKAIIMYIISFLSKN